MIVFCNPPARRVQESHDRPDYPHLGLALCAAVLRNRGQSPRIVDGKLLELDITRTVNQIIELSPRILALTAMTHEITVANEIASALKQRFSDLTVIIGGVHATALPAETLKEFASFDLAVAGEGEELLAELTGRILSEKELDLSTFSGIAWRRTGEILFNPGMNRVMDLDRLPRPAFDLSPTTPLYPIITGRGCPFGCTFCMRPYGRQVRYRSIATVLDEIEWIMTTFSPQRLIFYDETFTLRNDRSAEVLAGLRRLGIPGNVSWNATTHVNTLTPELAMDMKRSGCHRLSMGAESGDPAILEASGKGSSLTSVRKAFAAAHGAGLITEGFFIMGHPGENVRTLLKTIRFAIQVNPTIPVFGIMVPYPGTEIARMAAASLHGYRLRSMNWDDYNKQIGGALSLQGLPRKVIELFQVCGYVSVFLFNGRFREFFRFLWHFRKEAFSYLRNISRIHKGRETRPGRPESKSDSVNVSKT